MIVFQTVRSLLPSNLYFFDNAPQDDLITKIAKKAYQLLEYLFGLIEKGVDYMIKDIEPEPFYIRYKWSIRITLISLSILGIYMGAEHVKARVNQYIYSFLPDFILENYEKMSNLLERILNTKETKKDDTNNYVQDVNKLEVTENITPESSQVFDQEGFQSEKSEINKVDENIIQENIQAPDPDDTVNEGVEERGTNFQDESENQAIPKEANPGLGEDFYELLNKGEDFILSAFGFSKNVTAKFKDFVAPASQSLYSTFLLLNSLHSKITNGLYDLSDQVLKELRLEWALNLLVKGLKVATYSFFIYKLSKLVITVQEVKAQNAELINKLYLALDAIYSRTVERYKKSEGIEPEILKLHLGEEGT